MKTLRRWLGPIKRRLGGLVEAKIGIMLQQPVISDSRISTPERPVSAPELTQATKYRPDLKLSEAEFIRRSRRGNVLYELYVDSDPVTYGWVGQGGARVGILHDLQFTVPDHAFYIWDCATLPSHRGQGHFQTLLRSLIASRRTTSDLALVAVDRGNSASRKALEKAGFEPIFTYFSMRVAGRVLLSLAFSQGRFMGAQQQFDRLGH